MIFFMIALQKVNPHIHICPGDQLSISAVKQAFGSLTWFFWKLGSFNKPPTSLPSCWRFCHPLKNSILRLRYWYYIISTVCVLYIYQVYIIYIYHPLIYQTHVSRCSPSQVGSPSRTTRFISGRGGLPWAGMQQLVNCQQGYHTKGFPFTSWRSPEYKGNPGKPYGCKDPCTEIMTIWFLFVAIGQWSSLTKWLKPPPRL